MNPLPTIDQSLSSINMYRLVAVGLSALLAVAVIFSFTGVLPQSAWWLVASSAAIGITGFAAGHLSQRALGVPANTDSSFITTLILCLIMAPAQNVHDLWLLALTTLIAVLSKYVLAFRRRHFFNPAALGAAVMTISGLYPVTWWVGSPVMLPFVLLLGILVVRKTRRHILNGAFLLAATFGMAMVSLTKSQPFGDLVVGNVISGPLVFFATIMLTEPSSMPARLNQQVAYASIVGLLAVSQLSAGPLHISMVVALLIGNLAAYAFNRQGNYKMTFVRREDNGDRLSDYIFAPERPIHFVPGQYLEWTIPMKSVDQRGNRRTFSIASAPYDDEVRIGLKHYDPSSGFKSKMRNLKPGDLIMASHVAGDFVLPKDTRQKLVFIAGGIGVTPFRSMVAHMVATSERRDVTLFYLAASEEEIMYRDLFAQAAEFGVKLVPVIGSGRLNVTSIRRRMGGLSGIHFYISGPNGLVDRYRNDLRQAGVESSHIATDHFSGY